ncbi:preprotein translocase subunit SecE [Clostridium sp. N3C]|uniref:preprotein translocase subunit SecE n=1 Tax=Clostridium sp. N3C TaxID=1776758 RepID=UPI00092E09EE|nr:preprotein translocase subunit SecE [Clostridium sp. N3C]SCN26198.1 preprotein translocase subunit SecE [Clostridium sp. N3C]
MAMEAKVNGKKSKKGLASITGVFRGFKAELKRITWPNKKDIKKAAITVFAICAIYLVYLVIIDSAFQYLFNLILGIK